MTYRSRRLTDLAHEIPCRAQFKHECTGRWPQENGKYLSVAAHSNELIFGRGHGHKSHDCFFAALCPTAHDQIDGRAPGLDAESKKSEWLRAYIATQEYLWTHGLVRAA